MSRDGWAVVDDSTNWGLDQNDWWQSPNTDQVDLYFFGHGLDFKQAVFDYSLIGGKQAMVPRYAAGIAWTRWYDLDNRGVADVVDAYKGWQMPLDTFILDMDWHTKQGWGGYSFDRRLFPTPSDTLVGLLKEHYNLAVAVNLHDDDGIRPTEDTYNAMCTALGYDPKQQQTIPFCSPIARTRSRSRISRWRHRAPRRRFHVDRLAAGRLAGRLHRREAESDHLAAEAARHRCDSPRPEAARHCAVALWRPRRAPLPGRLLGRCFGGEWNTLAYQPYFSYTGANVLYSYWSHDIVGAWSHDHELHTRWIQWGSVSGHFRTHDRGMSAGTAPITSPSRARTSRRGTRRPPTCGRIASPCSAVSHSFPTFTTPHAQPTTLASVSSIRCTTSGRNATKRIRAR
jgi:hypothetical protein